MAKSRGKFDGKKITLMGLGLLGRGVGDARFLVKSGADLLVTDIKKAKDLESSVAELKAFENIKFVLGKHDLKDFRNRDLIIKAAGVPLDSPYIIEAAKNSIPVEMSAALFSKLTKAETIGVTGTRGKSTVSAILYEILKLQNLSKRKVFLGGNIKGLSTLELLPKTKKGDVVVMELDSWQLQGFGGTHFKKVPHEISAGFSPHVVVFTTFMPDHMNYYAGNMERYFLDKANIYRFQNRSDILVTSKEVLNFIKKYGPEPRGKIIIADSTFVPKNWKPKIAGEHNKLNIALAITAAYELGVSKTIIKEAVESFETLPGRMQLVRNFRGVKFYNDTNATTPEATEVALATLGKNTFLIFGGAYKNLDVSKLVESLPKYIKGAIVLPGTGTEKIRKNLEKISKKIPVTFVSNLSEAIDAAIKLAKKGDTIIMSPAFASFGLFKNEYDRGDQFDALVKKLK